MLKRITIIVSCFLLQLQQVLVRLILVFTALKLKELLGLEGKIIYALPFTSIIEQNYYAIIDIFKEIDEYKLSPRSLYN